VYTTAGGVRGSRVRGSEEDILQYMDDDWWRQPKAEGICVRVRVSVCVCKSLSFLMCKDVHSLRVDMRSVRSKTMMRRRSACRACISASRACGTCIRTCIRACSACRTCCSGCRVWRGYREPAEHTIIHRKKTCIRRIHRAQTLHVYQELRQYLNSIEFLMQCLRTLILPAYLSLGISVSLSVSLSFTLSPSLS
jgi:hypothetical protein